MRGQRRGSTESGDSLLGDEELEEGVGDGGGGQIDRFGSADRGGGERLSLELERGFKDDSDGSSEDEQHRGRRP